MKLLMTETPKTIFFSITERRLNICSRGEKNQHRLNKLRLRRPNYWKVLSLKGLGEKGIFLSWQ
jgi:hypothetical protein